MYTYSFERIVKIDICSRISKQFHFVLIQFFTLLICLLWTKKKKFLKKFFYKNV